MVQLPAHRTLRLEVRCSRAHFRRRTGGPWEVRVTHADGRLLALVPAGASANAAGRVHGEMCGNLRLMTEDQSLQHYGEGNGMMA